ncbi:response regulator transcription factor [Leptolyngbya sp. 7M]|uniref:response regulator transcription factor n=1 Tax=Leptolyngbya sp. 7M TaxID=2812896 RepID=UPI001B8C4FEF|nr:helix-turn-helix transcriptional regulator [Leptolyngbya sp. 7M]QYO66870.1 helix-turn-helix transcriptional regulator [Leptolyngbya sp. 7M]
MGDFKGWLLNDTLILNYFVFKTTNSLFLIIWEWLALIRISFASSGDEQGLTNVAPIISQTMTILTNSDLHGIFKFLQRLHTLCDQASLPSHVISILPEVLPGEFLSYLIIDLESQEVKFLASSIPNVEEDLGIKKVADDYVKKNRSPEEHPIIHHYLKTGNGRAFMLSDFSSRQQVDSLEGLYQMSMRLLGLEDLMMIFLPVDSTPTPESKQLKSNQKLLTVNVLRSQRNFSERDRSVLNILRPHFFQAYQNAQAVTRMQQKQAQLNQTIEQLSLVILNYDGKVQHITQHAWTLLSQYFQVSHHCNSPLPEVLQRWIKHQIALFTQIDSFSLPNQSFQMESEGKRLTIRFIFDRKQGQYLLLLEEDPPRTFSIDSLELLGLTRREAEVLFWVAKDKSNGEIATTLGCSDKTIKKHLEHIYAKFSVQTRTGAVLSALVQLGMVDL